MTMKAITTHQPYASLIAVGAKRYETRSWHTHYRGPIAIHAGKSLFNADAYLDRRLWPIAEALGMRDIYSFDKYPFPYGAVVATAKLGACLLIEDRPQPWDGGKARVLVSHAAEDGSKVEFYLIVNRTEVCFGDWRQGRYLWRLDDVERLPCPVPCRGRQGLWNWEIAA